MGAMNELINVTVLAALARQFRRAAPDRGFAHLTAITSVELDALNLRARSDLVAAALQLDLPDSYAPSAIIIRAALEDPKFSGWGIWPVTEAVATLALADGRPSAFNDGLALLTQLSPRLTSEFAIRRFLEADLTRSIPIVTEWTSHPDPAVRRLASEGTRPFLPWAIRVRSILADPESTIPILDALKNDDSDYVSRSVANHLNDLSRENADLVVALLENWLQTPEQRTHWIARHGLRTLIKRAHPGALALMGFAPAALTVSDRVLAQKVVVAPGSLEFAFDITNHGDAPAAVAVDYVIHFMKSNGGQSEKVFKLAVKTLQPGATASFVKRHGFQPRTTRVHYPGAHGLEIQVNGVRSGRTEFSLEI